MPHLSPLGDATEIIRDNGAFVDTSSALAAYTIRTGEEVFVVHFNAKRRRVPGYASTQGRRIHIFFSESADEFKATEVSISGRSKKILLDFVNGTLFWANTSMRGGG